MALKTISRNAYNAITIDSKKIDDNYLAILKKENEMNDAIIQNEVIANSNKESLDFEDAEEVGENMLEIEGTTVLNDVPAQQQSMNLSQESESGPNF
ncbi:hypothetical protein [Flavobacterium anhuiense]|uniref:hypothetical protein n=1 Tax=Flavobacterium anhuiense TaxID=459526 RepID=UPI002025E1B9|nr:hypothetical protein [Flavobacterium anhuiense]URM37187.1 hypothetical protein LLY39_00920 [Flavobacterium anhuiense]